MMRLSTATAWLDWIATVHPKQIDLGLDRVRQVAVRLDLQKAPCTTILVAGTNGKGSTVAGIDTIYREAHYRVGTFTSPFLYKPHEMVRINGEMISDEAFCEAFLKVDAARGTISLTPFEFQTLAALYALKQHSLDVWVLEIGLGGRLDAVNVLDADVAVITSIDLDHMDYLGETREKIALEKAGICRENTPLVCGDPDPPASLKAYVKTHHVPFYGQDAQFQYETNQADWSWSYQTVRYDHQPYTPLATQNMSTVMMVMTLLQSRLPVHETAIVAGLKKVSLPGRIQIMKGRVTRIFDVSHNPASVALLASRLKTLPCQGKTLAVFSMLKDKSILQSIPLIAPLIDDWYTAPLATPRTTTIDHLQMLFKQQAISAVKAFPSIKEAYAAAQQEASAGDRIIVFGSFHTISEALTTLPPLS